MLQRLSMFWGHIKKAINIRNSLKAVRGLWLLAVGEQQELEKVLRNGAN